MQAKNGNWQWILGRGMATSRGANGKARCIGTHSDIMRHKELENSLRFGKRKMQSIFRHPEVGIGVVSQRVLTEVNDLFLQNDWIFQS